MKQEEGPSQETTPVCEACEGRGYLGPYLGSGWPSAIPVDTERRPCFLCSNKRKPVVES